MKKNTGLHFAKPCELRYGWMMKINIENKLGGHNL